MHLFDQTFERSFEQKVGLQDKTFCSLRLGERTLNSAFEVNEQNLFCNKL